MKARGKLVSLLMALVCLLPIGMGLLGFGDSASAATPQKINVTLHKKKMDEFPTGGIQNNGLVMPDFDNDYDPLPGVEFRPYDITKDFYTELAKENLTGNETDEVYNAAVKRVMEKFHKDTYTPNAADAVAPAQTTDADGKVTFTDLDDRDADGTYKVYLFFETENTANGQYSQPLVLILPAKHPDTDQPLTDIHLYPKNQLANVPEKELLDDNGVAVDGSEGKYSYDIGKEIKYKASFMIPSQIGEIIKNPDGSEKQTRYSKLVFKDEVDQDGIKFVGIEKILIDGQPINKDVFTGNLYADTTFTNDEATYLPTGKKAGFEIAMKLNGSTAMDNRTDFNESKRTAEYLADYKGKKIEIFYSVKLTEHTKVDEEINNDFTVTLKQHDRQEDKKEVEDTPPPVTTGGKKFIKHEADKPEQTLKGAEFVITNEGGTKFLAGDANNYRWDDVVDDKYVDAIRITSLDNGVFEIKGLKYGTYNLVETKAPDGYKLGGPFKFVVNDGSYSVEEPLRDKIPNVSRGGFLPSTGGAGIIAFLVIGLSLMGIAIVRYRKTQHAA